MMVKVGQMQVLAPPIIKVENGLMSNSHSAYNQLQARRSRSFRGDSGNLFDNGQFFFFE